MDKLTILKLGNIYGWAYHFIALNQQKYSKHNIVYQLTNKTGIEDIIKINPQIIYFYCPPTPENTAINNIIQRLPSNIKVIGGYAGEVKYRYCSSDLIVSISYPFLKEIKSLYPNKEVVFLPEGVDDTFFTPKPVTNNKTFTVGWAGRPHGIKRFYLLGMLKYLIKPMMNYDPYSSQDKTLERMKEFYHSLDVFILPSKSETSSGVTMEAMACGLPVVATDVGNIRMLLDPEWIVPNDNDRNIIKNINEKLDILKENPQLRKEIGERNRKHIEKYFTWRQNQLIWDEVFEAIYRDDYEKIKQLSESYLEPFKRLYE